MVHKFKVGDKGKNAVHEEYKVIAILDEPLMGGQTIVVIHGHDTPEIHLPNGRVSESVMANKDLMPPKKSKHGFLHVYPGDPGCDDHIVYLPFECKGERGYYEGTKFRLSTPIAIIPHVVTWTEGEGL